MSVNQLSVSETFYSLQGEGQNIGKPAVFLRLSGCNLLCSSESWICDTIEVWKKGVKTDFKDVLSADFISRLKDGAHLVITGGEPLLHQNAISNFLSEFVYMYKFTPTVEIETNGTIDPSEDMLMLIDFWNCSPKLKNSGESAERRINLEAIHTINAYGNNATFKFVVSDPEDLIDLFNDYGQKINTDNIILMPAGDTREKLSEIREKVVQMCIDIGYRFSDRLQILTWNKKTGV